MFAAFFLVNRREHDLDAADAFQSLLGIGLRTKPVTYQMLISPEVAG